MKKETFNYVLMHRPFSIGVCPKDFIEVKTNRIENWFAHHETIVYNRALTEDEVNSFEMICIDDSHMEIVADVIVSRMGKYAKEYLKYEDEMIAKIKDISSENFYYKFDVINRLKDMAEIVKNKIKAL